MNFFNEYKYLSMSKNPYCCPVSKENLEAVDSGLISPHGAHYPFLTAKTVNPIPVFIDESMLSGGDKISRAMYKKDDAELVYENFLICSLMNFSCIQ